MSGPSRASSCQSAGRSCPALRLLNARGGAIGLIVASLSYLGGTLLTGHSAASQPPVEVSAPGAALSAWEAARLLLGEPADSVIVDVRSPAQYAQYALDRSVNVPDASVEELLRAAGARRHVLVVAASDDAAAALVGGAGVRAPGRRWHYLAGGARAWYLAFTLPVPLFNEAPPPFGYLEARATVAQALQRGATSDSALQALNELRSLEYAPTLLEGKKAPAAAKGRKKISGGCGG